MKQRIGLALILTAGLAAVAFSAWWYFGPGAAPPLPPRPSASAVPREPQPPEYAPDFKLVDLDGDTHRLSTWTGKRNHYVLLNFWAPWCGPCREEVPLLIDLQTRYADRGLQILGPAVDRREAVVRYVKKMGINYPVFPGRDRIIALSEAFGNTLSALPYSVLVAPDGRILRAHAGALTREEAQRWLQPLLADERQ